MTCACGADLVTLSGKRRMCPQCKRRLATARYAAQRFVSKAQRPVAGDLSPDVIDARLTALQAARKQTRWTA